MWFAWGLSTCLERKTQFFETRGVGGSSGDLRCRMKLLPMSLSHRSAGVLLVVGVLVGVTVGGSVTAGPSTKVTWKVSSLQVGQVKNLSAVVSTNSSGVKTWSKKGSCTLTPTKKPTKLTMGATGSCVLTLKIAKSKSYPAISSKKTITLVAPTTTTSVPSTTTSVSSTTTSVASTTTVALTCAAGGACVVGNTGPGGGTVFYVASTYFTSTGSACGTTCNYLEAAPTGWITTPAGQVNCPIQNTGEDPQCQWSGITSSLVTTGLAIGTGYANTSAMITQSNVAGKAGTVARGFQGGGKTDWFLPSRDELNEMYSQRTIIGGFNTHWYWSSSEDSGSSAKHQYFPGLAGAFSKTFSGSVRPVRAF